MESASSKWNDGEIETEEEYEEELQKEQAWQDFVYDCEKENKDDQLIEDERYE